MRWTTILYALFCLGVIALFTLAMMRSYSPFADSGPGFFTARGTGGASGVHGARGPTHK